MKKRIKITLPKYFLLKDKYIYSAIRFLRKIMSIKKQDILIDFSKLQDTRKEDVMVFYAQVEKANHVNKTTAYKTPHKGLKNERLKKLFSIKAYHHLISPQSYQAIKATTLIPDTVNSISKKLRTVGIRNDFSPLKIILTELIGNAIEHGLSYSTEINWWLTITYNKIGSISFTFVDMGMGIIKSYQNAGLPFKYRFLPSKRIPIDALEDKLGSSTKKSDRGMGLPQIMSFVKKGFISNFILITNNVSLQYINGKYNTKRHQNFVGTYYSWVIDKENYISWKNTL
jgi:hypothetical protein